MLMLMAPGEDFLDVIAKVLPPTDIIDYKLLLWHPDILGSIAQPSRWQKYQCWEYMLYEKFYNF